MEIAVLGAGGFVGINLLEELAETDHDVVASDVVPIDGPPGAAEFARVDITDHSAVDDVIEGVDAVVHLAAHQLPDSLEEPRKNAEVNVLGTLSVLDAARKHDVEKVFFPSASSIVGNVDGDAAPETIRPDPQSPYGVAKHAVEEYLDVYNDLYGLDYLAFRFFNVYGPHQHPESGAFVPTVMSRLMAGEGVYVTGDGKQVRDFIYVEDLTGFILEGIERDDVANEVINMGYGEKVTLIDAIRTIADVAEVDPDIERRPARDDEIDDFCADMSKCERVFGHHPETDFETGIARTHEWMQTALSLE